MTNVELAAIVRDYANKAVTAALAPVLEANKVLEMRVLELETRPAVIGPAGEKGDPGLQGVGIASLLVSAEGRLMAHLSDGRTIDAGPVPRGLDGAPGPAGEPGARGEKGLDGLNGAPGEPGRPGIDGKDGAQGLQGKDGLDGLNGKDGADGLHGKDGIGVIDAVLDRAGHLLLTLSDGRTKDVGLVTGLDGKEGQPGLNGKDGRDGLNGKDGADGMTIEDAGLVVDDEGWKFRLMAGGSVKDFPLPIPHDVGPWSAGATYPAGAGVSHDGGYWIAKRLTNETPGSSEAWRLAVRRGKQGKEGPRGKDGRDLTPSNTPALYS